MRLPSGKTRNIELDGVTWIRPAVVVLTLLLGAVVATSASPRQLALIPIAIVVVGMLVVFLRWPPVGLILATITGLIIPYSGPSGLSVTMLLIAALFGLWMLGMATRQHEFHFVSSRVMWPLVGLIVFAVLSFSFGRLPWFNIVGNAPLQAQLGGLAIVVLSPVAFLLVANQVKDLAWLSRLTWVFVAFATMSFAARTALPLLGLPTRDLFPSVGSLFYVWFVAMALSQAIFNRDLHSGWRGALAALVLITVYILFFAKFADKSGWLPAVVTLCALIWLRSRPAGIAFMLAGLLFASYILPDAIATDSYSISTRFDAWLIMAQLIQLSPLWGLGFANYYAFTPLFPIRGYYVRFNSHNNYVDIVAQMGVLGLACVLWFYWEVAVLGWRIRQEAPAGFARAYVYGALAGLVGTAAAGMLGDWVLPFVYNIGLNGFRSSVLAWMFLGGLVTIEQVIIRARVTA